jgi:hypothetical protein
VVDQIRVVDFVTPGGVGTLDITHPELTETFKAAILILSASTTGEDDTNINHGRVCLGFVGVDSGVGYDINAVGSFQAQNGLGTVANANHGSDNDICLQVWNSAGTALLISAAYDSTIPNGVRLTFSASFAARGTAILFGGIGRAACGTCSSTPGGLAELVGDSTNRFSPDLVLFIGADTQVDPVLINADGCLRLGMALNKAGLPQVSAFLNTEDGADPTDSDGIVRAAAAWTFFEAGVRTTAHAQTVTSFDASGFTVDTDGTSPDAVYLAIKWADASRVRMAAANLLSSGSTGIQTFNSFGFTPDVVLGMSTLMASLDTLTDGPTASSGSYFATGRYGSRAFSVSHQEGLAITGPPNTNAQSRMGPHAVLTLDHTGAVAQQADWVGGSGSGGFSLNFSTATAGYMTALGIQIIPNPPLPARRARLATKRSRKRSRRPTLVGGVRVSLALVRALRAVQRFRRAMQARLRWKPRLPTVTPMPTMPSATGQDAMGSVFSGGVKRGEVASGGSKAGGVF